MAKTTGRSKKWSPQPTPGAIEEFGKAVKLVNDYTKEQKLVKNAEALKAFGRQRLRKWQRNNQ